MGLSIMKRRLIFYFTLVLAVFAVLIALPDPLTACGGPAMYEIVTPTYGPDFLFGYLESGDDYEEVTSKEEFQFLYPFKVMKRDTEALERLSAHEPKFPRPPSYDDFQSAIGRSDFKEADKYARLVVEEMLDMPATAADNYQLELNRALEFIEIEPLIKTADPKILSKALTGKLDISEIKLLPAPILDAFAVRDMDKEKVDEFLKEHPGNPRTPTLRFLALQKKFKREIPDGWPNEIRKWVPASKWREFEDTADEWMKDYPEHPLYDLVKLWKNRVYTLEGRDDLAAENLFDIYPRHLPRVLYEMRFVHFSDEKIVSLTDPVLFTAMVSWIEKVTPEQWTKWWSLSEKNIKEPWAVNLQERLLLKASHLIKPGILPEGFPARPANPTELWGQLRAVGLMKADKWDAAKEQIFSLKPDRTQALLAATYYVRQNELLAAVQVEGLYGSIDPSTGEFLHGWPEFKTYLIRVLIDDEGLKKLSSAKDKTTRDAALYSEGVRLASFGNWDEAADLIKNTDRFHAHLWKKAAALSRDDSPSGLLKYARFLKAQNGELFYGTNTTWYGTLNERYEDMNGYKPGGHGTFETEGDAERRRKGSPWNLPWSVDYESDAIKRDLTGTSEIWLSLQAYVKWLALAKPSPEMREVVKEADSCYNKLINASAAENHFWKIYLDGKKIHFINGTRTWETLHPVNPVVVKLREAGKRAEINYPKEKAKPKPPKITFVERTDIPESVKKEWKAVKIAVKDMNTGIQTEYIVNIGESMRILDTDFKVKILAFLPDSDYQFRRPNAMNIESTIITTKSDRPDNPAVQMVIEERGKEVIRGVRRLGTKRFNSAYENKRFKLFFIEGIRREAAERDR